MHDVFISYSTKDMSQAETVRDVLEKNGIPCWMAPRDIPGGSNYAREIPQAIRSCQVFVLILSENAQTSNWVVKELDNAVNCGKIIMPLMLEDCPLNDEFNFLLTGAQRYAAYQKSAEVLSTLVERIKAVTGHAVEQKAEEPKAPPAPETPQKKAAPQTAPVVRQAKPRKQKEVKQKVPFTPGKPEKLALLAIPAMMLVSVLGYLVGNSLYFSSTYPYNYHFGNVVLYARDYKMLAFYVVLGAVIGTVIWLEWSRFYQSQQVIPPACPSCGSVRMEVKLFRTGRLVLAEWLTLLVIPLWVLGGLAAQFVMMGFLLPVSNGAVNVDWVLAGMLGAGVFQGIALGFWHANYLVRRFRKKLGLASRACRCVDCRAKFLPVLSK